MTELSYYFRIPIWDRGFCFSYSEQNTLLGIAMDGYPDGTTQILVGKVRAGMSPGADTEQSTDLIFH